MNMKIYEADGLYNFRRKEDAMEMALSLWQEAVYQTFIYFLQYSKDNIETALKRAQEKEKEYSEDNYFFSVEEKPVF